MTALRNLGDILLLCSAQDYHIPACHAKYPFLLHCGDDHCAEALRGHGGLDDVGVLPAGPAQNPEVIVYQD